MITAFLLDLIFPKKCLCGKWDTFLCDDCFRRINRKKTQLCPLCKKISENGKTCPSCRSRTNLSGVMVFGTHEGLLRDLIWEYKYEFIRDLDEPLSLLLSEKFGAFTRSKNFLITSIPISKKRFLWRGFNQSQLLARAFSNKVDLEYAELLKRKNARPQVGLSRKDRIKNLEGQFTCLDRFQNKKVLIVDDVYTSGATLEEAASTLRKVGAREVWGLVLSRE